ncbi:MAG: hypothetical protein J2P35_12010 [Actinobacteria bacterium]|nr:hypothetical protein [Actinomycetota bacterium]MBO0786789.1 hypothetical protein [Actinomycetota bacterium]
MTRQSLIADFLRTQAGWRLTYAGSDPLSTARCVAALLDAAAFAATLPDDDPDLTALGRCGCFRGAVFDPGPKGITIARWWQYGDVLPGSARPVLPGPPAPADPRELISALTAAVSPAAGQAVA